MNPRVTIVIPTYRRPALLRRAIASALAQTVPDVRVAVFDNASGDETGQVVAALARKDPRVAYHAHPANLGAVANFQSGIDAVTTPWFCLLSDDDLLLPGFVGHALARLEEHPRARFFCGPHVRYHVDDGREEVRPSEGWREGLHEAGESVETMVRHLFAWTGVLFGREVPERAGALENIEMTDLLFMTRAAASCPFVVSLRPCAITTRWGGNTLRNMPVEALVRSFRVTADRLAELPGCDPGTVGRIRGVLRDRVLHALRRRMGADYVLAGEWEMVRQAGEYLAREGHLPAGRRIRLRLSDARYEGGAARAALTGCLKLRRTLARRGRQDSPAATLDEVVRRWSARLAG